MPNDARIKIRHLKKVIKDRTIIHDLYLDLYPGEVYGLIGPNGAGKSTTIKMLVGLSAVTEGDIYYEDLNYRDNFVEIKKHIGAIVENPDLYRFISGRKLLEYSCCFYPDLPESRVDEVISLVRMDYAVDKPPRVYSLGMKQRLALALALLPEPEFLVLDEPTNGLDPQGIREMRLLLRNLAEEHNVTVLVSSHILGEMQALCDRVGLIHQGELLKVGRVSEISEAISGHGMRILCDRPADLCRYFNARGVAFMRQADYVRVQCDPDYVNNLLTELMDAGFKLYAAEPEHANLEESFMRLIGEKGGEIR